MAYNPQCPPKGPIVCPPTVINNDIYIPQLVEVIHPIEIVNRYHCVPVYRHVTKVTCSDNPVTVSSRKKGKRR